MIRIPEGMMARVRAADPVGRVEALQVRPARRRAPEAVATWSPGAVSSDGSGPRDHARSAKRAVTLLQAEHLAVMASMLGRPVSFDATRRNVLVSGLNLSVLVGRRFAVGTCILEGTEACHPCARMEEDLGTGGYAAMMGHGGLCARIVVPGVVSVGDVVRLVPEDATTASVQE